MSDKGERKKKISEMTFKEFWQEAEKKKGVSEAKAEVLRVLGREGFTEEQLNPLNMKKVWDIYLFALADETDRILGFFNDELKKPLSPRERESINNILANLSQKIKDLEKESKEES